MAEPPQEFFVRDDGKKIRLLADYFDIKESWPLGNESFEDFVDGSLSDEFTVHPHRFINKCIETNHQISQLSNVAPKRERFTRMLDLGGGPGVRPRLLKALGYVDEVWVVDLHDREEEYSKEDAADHLKTCSKALRSEAESQAKETIFNISKNRNHSHLPSTPLPGFFYNADSISIDSFEFDKYVVNDVNEFLDDSGDLPEFDLVTSFASLAHFQIEEIFNQVNKILSPGGIFWIKVANFYTLHGGSLEIPTDAPFLHTRLSKDDLLRYFKEVRPEVYEAAKKAIFMPEPHTTLQDFWDYASNNSMDTLHQRFIANSDLMHDFLSNNGSYFYDKVLPQARDINPTVSPKSFFSRHKISVHKKAV